MRKTLIHILLMLLIFILVMWCFCGYFYSTDKRVGIDEIRADIQRVRENQSRIIKRLESNSAKAKEVSDGLGEVISGADVNKDRITRSQELIREGFSILNNIKERDKVTKD